MIYFDNLKTKNNISNTFLIIFTGFSILWLCFCSALLFPFARELIIRFGESLVHRPINHPMWHEKILSAGIGGLIFYFIFFLTFLFNDTYLEKTLNKISIIFLIAVSTFLVFLIMYRANWTFTDDREYITSTAINKMYPFWTSGGRFFPLGHIHYDLPLFIFRCLGLNTGLPVEAHFTMVAVFCVVSVLCLYVLLKKIKPFTDKNHPFFVLFFACSFFFLGSDFSYVFLSLIFPETQGIMLLSIFMLMYYKALKTDNLRYYVVALIVAVYNTYCKEPVFGVFLVIALTNLLFRYKGTSKQEKIFYFTLIANGLIFLILYYFLSYKNNAVFYNEGRETAGRFQLLLSVLIKNPVLFIIILFGFFRLFFVLIKKDREHLYYDSLLFAGISYTFAYIILRLGGSYYFMPSIILFLPSLVYWIKYAYSKKFALALCMFFSLIPIYAYNYFPTTSNTVKILKERQIFMPYISDLLLEYNKGNEFTWYESDNKITENTFYIDARNWRKHVLNAFLNYQNKSEGKEFFTIIRSQDRVDMNQHILFFYPMDNDQSQPMQDELVKFLHDNNFILYEDNFAVLIYKRHLFSKLP